MRAPLDLMMDSLGESLTQMGAAVEHLLIAAYAAADQAERMDAIGTLQAEVDHHAAAMESLVIDVLATQQPVLATDLSVVKGLLVASRQLWQIAHQYRDLMSHMSQLGIKYAQLPAEVSTILPEVRQVVKESIAAFLHDDRILADFTQERVARLDEILRDVPAPPHPPTLVPVPELHRFALRQVLDSAREIARSAPVYRYVTLPD